MKAVGIKVLKDNLSRYLRAVREGETVYVTDRDTVIAEIHRPLAPANHPGRWQTFLHDEEQSGALQPARATGGGPPLARLAEDPPHGLKATSLQSLLDAIKGD
jgi:antitoxin (DNA-binding transcriptional repressor) of toxin-antitoxin stability system